MSVCLPCWINNITARDVRDDVLSAYIPTYIVLHTYLHILPTCTPTYTPTGRPTYVYIPTCIYTYIHTSNVNVYRNEAKQSFDNREICDAETKRFRLGKKNLRNKTKCVSPHFFWLLKVKRTASRAIIQKIEKRGIDFFI